MATRKRPKVKSEGERRRSPRDYAAEYAHRIAKALSKGLSRSQGRGHPKATEALVSAKPPKPLSDEKLQHALGVLRQGKNLAKAAKSVGVSPERLRRIAVNKGAITKEDQGWIVRPDLPRRMPLYSRGREIAIVVGDFDTASLIGRYMSAVGQFLTTNNRALAIRRSLRSANDGAPTVVETRHTQENRISQLLTRWIMEDFVGEEQSKRS